MKKIALLMLFTGALFAGDASTVEVKNATKTTLSMVFTSNQDGSTTVVSEFNSSKTIGYKTYNIDGVEKKLPITIKEEYKDSYIMRKGETVVIGQL